MVRKLKSAHTALFREFQSTTKPATAYITPLLPERYPVCVPDGWLGVV